MDSSFLTFSPKALSRKKLAGNIIQGPVRSRILKSKICPLQDARCSPSSLHNIEKNRRESIDSKKSNSVVLDDSIIITSEKINCRSPLPCVPKLFCSEQRSSAKYPTFISKRVRRDKRQSATSDKFDEIWNWLDELHTEHERKKLSSPWSSLNSSSVIECSPVSDCPPKSGTKSASTSRIPETSSDENSENLKQKGSVSNYNSEASKKKDTFKGIIPESSDNESFQPARPRKVCLIFSDDENDGSSDRSQLSSEEKKTTDSLSNKSNEGSLKLLLPCSKDHGSGRCSRASFRSDDSVISISSADRIISDLYANSWNKDSVLTPVVEKRKTVVKKQTLEVNTGSISSTLSQLYGKSWDEEKVLTPLLNRGKTKKGKENTPPVNRKEVDSKRPLLTPKTQVTINKTPKTCLGRRQVSELAKSHETLSFLRSLSSCSPKKCNPEALLYKKEFKKNKDGLCTRLFKMYNAEVFEKKLPCNLKIEWNVRMKRTAGLCRNRTVTSTEGKIRTSRIELSTKVCNTADRVRDTLIHELCHAATWIIDGVVNGHGAVWQAWTKKAMARFPELPRIGRCHSYSIETKYTYKCKNCGYSFGRHSKSLDLQRKRCGYCYGEFDLLVNTISKIAKNTDPGVPSTPKPPRAASGFALYVKENYRTTKEKNFGLKHAEIMKLLGNQFAGMKLGPSLQV